MLLDLGFKFFILWLEELYPEHMLVFAKFPGVSGALGGLSGGLLIVVWMFQGD